MKQEEYAKKLIDDIKLICSDDISDEEAAKLAAMFVEILIKQVKKMEFYRVAPQVTYLEGVLNNIS